MLNCSRRSFVRPVSKSSQQSRAGRVTEAAQKGNTQLSTVGWISSDPVVLSNIFHSKNEGAWNLSHYSNPELDAILDEVKKTSDPVARQDLHPGPAHDHG